VNACAFMRRIRIILCTIVGGGIYDAPLSPDDAPPNCRDGAGNLQLRRAVQELFEFLKMPAPTMVQIAKNARRRKTASGILTAYIPDIIDCIISR